MRKRVVRFFELGLIIGAALGLILLLIGVLL